MSSQTKCLDAGIKTKSVSSMCPLEASNPTTAGPEHFNIAEVQEKGFKLTFTNVINLL